jgi:ribosomal protein S27AE
MAEPSPQRAYRAACPGCGAPVLFRSAQSTHAVCGYCHSTVVRQGEVLQRLGKLAELFDDHSPLQIGATGKHKGMGFVVVGRLQYQASQGPWTEWALVQDDGQPASLSEDNGSYVYSRPRTVMRELPGPERFRLGATTAIDGKSYAVSQNDTATLRSAEGELPRLPEPGHGFAWVELRSHADQGPGSVLTLDYSPTLRGEPVAVSLGQEVRLEDLHMAGLKVESARDEKGRQFNCPSCGAPVTVTLDNTKRMTCGSCHSLIDLTQGVGAEVVAAKQNEPVEPLIALGSQGQFQGKAWQVVGFQHRMGTEPDDPDEHFGWSEYLLYNAQRGFQFLVDTTEGWSLVKPTTGVPVLSGGGKSAKYLGTTYQLQYAYKAETSYVAGEFYWPVMRGQRSFNRDFASGNNLLSQEEVGQEITWSAGAKIKAELVASAFGLKDATALLTRVDAKPASELGWKGKVILVLVILLLIVLVSWLDRNDCDPNTQNCYNGSGSSSRSSGGSWGGYSSGGSHK